MSVTPTQVRAFVADLDATFESRHHGHPDFRGKRGIFATLSEREDRVAMRLAQLDARELARTSPDIYRLVSDRHPFSWVSVVLDKADPDAVAELLAQAWHLRQI